MQHLKHPRVASVGGLYPSADEHDAQNGYFKSSCIKFRARCTPSTNAESDFTKQIPDLSLEIAAKRKTDDRENGGKRNFNSFYGELVNKRAKIEGQEGKQESSIGKFPFSCISSKEKLLSEDSEWKCFSDAYNTMKANLLQGAPAVADFASFFPALEHFDEIGCNQLEHVCAPLPELFNRSCLPVGLNHYSLRRCVPVGAAHQAVLPQYHPQISKSSCIDGGHPSQSIATPAKTDKRMGICIVPMPELCTLRFEAQLCCTKEDCDCIDQGSTRCVRQHVMEARAKLKEELGKKKFTELGFSDMGEDVARIWASEDENLFHMIVLSNSASSGRNFWVTLSEAFPYRSFHEIASYYFNVFMLQKRAEQNRADPSKEDSDDDEFELHDEDGDDSVVESDEEDNGFYRGSMKPIDQNFNRDFSLDQDAEDDSCTSFDRNQEHQHVNHNGRDWRAAGFADYEYADGQHVEQKPWDEVNCIVGATGKEFDFSPTCNVIEEVFGLGSNEDDWGDGDLM